MENARFLPRIGHVSRMVFAPTDRKQLVWPVTGIVFGALIAVNPFYAPDLTLPVGIVTWCVDMVLVLILYPRIQWVRKPDLLWLDSSWRDPRPPGSQDGASTRTLSCVRTTGLLPSKSETQISFEPPRASRKAILL